MTGPGAARAGSRGRYNRAFGMPVPWRRLSTALVFLLAWIAIWLAWPQVGGQGHLDLMHWGWKLGLPLGGAWAAAGAARAALFAPRLISRGVVGWLLLLAAFGATAGWVTYNYHLQEEQLAPESGEGLADASRALFR